MQCPVCNKEKAASSVKTYLKSIQTLQENKGIWWWWDATLEHLSNMALTASFYSKIRWACDTCIKTELAILADPSKQKYCDHMPYLAYYDHHSQCKLCKKDFIFGARTQQLWYETYHFWVQRKPRHCPACRKTVRAEKKLNTELSNLLANGPPTTQENCQRVSELYLEMGLPERAKKYQTLKNKIR